MYGYYGGFYYDWTYLLVLAGMVLCLLASASVKMTFNRYAKVQSMSHMTGAQVAERILRENGITDVAVVRTSGSLTDHYNPKTNTVNLSDSTYGSTSVAAIAVAAHECGHVCQHYEKYTPIEVRSALVPIANIGSNLGIPVIIIGLVMGAFQPLIWIGIIMFSAGVLFQIVTLPVEFNASNRALKMLTSYGILGTDEERDASKVLRAAALTYVAAAASSIMQLIRLILLSKRRND